VKPAPATPVKRAQLVVLAVLGAAVAAWSFVLLRAQNAPAALDAICTAGGGCASLWSAPFALSVQRLTSVPVAGWGLVWGLAAAALGIAALVRARRGPIDAIVTSLRLLSAAGLLGVFVLLAVIVSERTFCAPCAGAHALVLAHAGVALLAWRRLGLARPGPGAVLAAGSLLWAYLVVVFTAGGVPASAIPSASQPDASADAALRDYVDKLPPAGRQVLADVLGRMRRGPALTLPPPRTLRGPATAPVRFTEFTDVRCSHCAELHQVWEELAQALPAGSFSVESRFYPLDGACNVAIRSPARDPVRCLAPRVQICREQDPGAHALAGALFAEQGTLTAERVYELAGGDRAALDACVAGAEARSKLEGDVALAEQYSPDGTPLVLVNGRLGSAQPAFLYAIVLARGSPDHPAFSVLPPADPGAHIH
jgi:protein-disulfide isomerase